ncbi:MAG: hypothetical protein LQ348_002096 [Seirophora lacunosa]|nr:MAG: hypothetical protein LQ348_002096 [Seirophora lacunosa]
MRDCAGDCITIHEPVPDLRNVRRVLNAHRSAVESGEDENQYRAYEILETAEPLLDQCDFLEEKLDIKRREYTILYREHHALKEKADGLKTENESLKTENEALKEELAALKEEGEKADGEAGNGEETSKKAGPSDNPRKRRAADSDIVAEGEEDAAKKS